MHACERDLRRACEAELRLAPFSVGRGLCDAVDLLLTAPVAGPEAAGGGDVAVGEGGGRDGRKAVGHGRTEGVGYQGLLEQRGAVLEVVEAPA